MEAENLQLTVTPIHFINQIKEMPEESFRVEEGLLMKTKGTQTRATSTPVLALLLPAFITLLKPNRRLHMLATPSLDLCRTCTPQERNSEQPQQKLEDKGLQVCSKTTFWEARAALDRTGT